MRRKRQPTEEQKARAAERREKFRTMVKEVGKLSAVQRAELAARVPALVTCEGHALSLHNQCLVALQHPGATILGGFRQWKRQGRSVKKGEKGIAIWIPKFPARDQDGESRDATEQGGEEKTPDEVRFLIGTVFDIGQTREAAERATEPEPGAVPVAA